MNCRVAPRQITFRTEVNAGLPETEWAFKSASTAKLLDQADFTDAVPASVTENTTRHLVEEETRRPG